MPLFRVRSFTRNFIDFLLAGGRMERRADWPMFLFRVMQSCWSAAPAERPTFAELAGQLGAERARLAQLAPMGTHRTKTHTYINTPPSGEVADPDGQATQPAPPATGQARQAAGFDYAAGPQRRQQRTHGYVNQMARTPVGPQGDDMGVDNDDDSPPLVVPPRVDQETPPRALAVGPGSVLGAGAGTDVASSRRRGGKPQRGKQASVYLGFGDSSAGGDSGSTAA